MALKRLYIAFNALVNGKISNIEGKANLDLYQYVNDSRNEYTRTTTTYNNDTAASAAGLFNGDTYTSKSGVLRKVAASASNDLSETFNTTYTTTKFYDRVVYKNTAAAGTYTVTIPDAFDVGSVFTVYNVGNSGVLTLTLTGGSSFVTGVSSTSASTTVAAGAISTFMKVNSTTFYKIN